MLAVSTMNVLPNRQNTLVCAFDMASPRISAYDIHEWVHENMKLEPTDVIMIQIDSTKRHVYLKLHDDKLVHRLIQNTAGQLKYKHPNGEVSNVKIAIAGTRTTRVRLANLPPEIGEKLVRNTLTMYGEVQEVTHETWTNRYRYPVANGIRIINMKLTKHIPSNMMMAGHRVLITYEGQPITCFGCGAEDHFYIDCPNRSKRTGRDAENKRRTWATIAAGGVDEADTESDAGSQGDRTNNTQGDAQIDEEQRSQTPQTTPKQTYSTNKMDEGEGTSKPETMTTHTQHTAEGHTPQPMDTTDGSQTTDQRQMIQTGKMTIPQTGGERAIRCVDTNDASGRQEQIQGKDHQEPSSWAEEVENSTEVEKVPEQTHDRSPKRTKKLKVDKGETKPPDRGRSRSRNAGKRN